jgi:Ni/Co efflux regulator RcnB
MKNILLIASALTMAAGMPAAAFAGGKGKGAEARSPSMKHSAKSEKRAHKNARAHNRYAGRACPPGLVKKATSCVPPGQASRLFREGQQVGKGYRYFTSYDDIPQDLRSQYNLDQANRYILRNDRIYQVDPTSNVVTRIINTIL